VDKELCPGLEVIALPQLLTRQGMLAQAPPSQQAASPLPAAATLSDQDQAHQLPAAQALPLCPPPSVSIHDSCPDRQKGVFAESVRALFANFELREMRHNRRQSRCCGLGKLLPLRNQQASQEMRSQRLAEFQQSGAELLVTYCLNCSQPLQGDNTYYYLELLFGIRVDWQELAVLGSEAMEVMSLSALP
jgi:Fe-S oxidoreductase